MNIGDRIKQRRIELGISADDLAKRVGKSRATIYRYENGDIENMPTPTLEPLAKALQTTPAYLMGWNEKTHSNEYNHYTKLVELYFNGIMHWSKELGISEVQTSAIRNHFSELLLRYKKLLERYQQTNWNWKSEKNSYLDFYGRNKNPKSVEEIEELYIREDLEVQLQDIEKWISTFPRLLAESDRPTGNELESIPTHSDDYLPELAAAHERTDIDINKQMKKHDDEIMDDDDF